MVCPRSRSERSRSVPSERSELPEIHASRGPVCPAVVFHSLSGVFGIDFDDSKGKYWWSRGAYLLAGPSLLADQLAAAEVGPFSRAERGPVPRERSELSLETGCTSLLLRKVFRCGSEGVFAEPSELFDEFVAGCCRS